MSDSPVEEKNLDQQIEVPLADDNTIVGIDGSGNVVNPKNSVGLAVIDQLKAIPKTGKRIPTTKWEYWTFVLFYFNSSSPIGGAGSSLRQAMLTLAHPDGFMQWGGQTLPVNSVILDISGIMLAVQLVILLSIGPYADYGNWRPWILIVAELIVWACEFGLIGISQVSQWATCNALWIVGNISLSIVSAFYFATYPGLVRDLPRMIQSEEDVANGVKTPEEHAKMDMYERAKIFNYCNIYGSGSAVVWFGIAIGISAAVGYASQEALIRAYRILLGYYTPITMACTIPFFICMKWRPGQAIPKDTPMWLVGPKQAWYALKCCAELKQALLYLCAYICLFEAIGAYLGVYFILQYETIHYSPELLSAFSLVGDACGAAGCAIILWLHKRYNWTVKWILFVSAIASLFPVFWGAIGTWTNVIGYHHVWEFWFFQVWNLFTSAASSYNVTMISEVAPASKLFMFYALFNIVSKSTGFVGPFVTAAIIKDSNNTNAAFWFMTAIGAVSLVLLFFIDTDKAKLDCARFLEREARERYSVEQRQADKANDLNKMELQEVEAKA